MAVDDLGMTSLPRLFAAGEMTGISTTWRAFASGFEAADGIDRYVRLGEARRRPPSGGSAGASSRPVAAGGQAPGGCGPYWDAWRGEEEVMGATADRTIYVGTIDACSWPSVRTAATRRGRRPAGQGRGALAGPDRPRGPAPPVRRDEQGRRVPQRDAGDTWVEQRASSRNRAGPSLRRSRPGPSTWAPPGDGLQEHRRRRHLGGLRAPQDPPRNEGLPLPPPA